MEAGATETPNVVANAAAVAIAPNAAALAAPPGVAEEAATPSGVLGLFSQMPKNGRQIGIIAAIALGVALSIAVIIWSQSQEYATLFNNLPDKEMGDVITALEKLKIPHKVDAKTGGLQIPAEHVHEVRLKLATQGLPKDGTHGFEIMDQERGFGTSQMMETARYQHALEGEIARSITTLQGVKTARVHLAFPKETVFIREKKKPSASVVVRLDGKHELSNDQVDAIVHLVASSVAQLEPAQVTVVDQEGHLLNSRERPTEMSLTAKQFEYKKQVEDHLMERINNILRPVVGQDGLSAQVSADIDFNVTERTQEMYNPETPAVRSEQTSEEQNHGSGIQGVPGALSNQPPAAGTAPEVATGQAGQASTEKTNINRSATRNFELDRTISHTRIGLGGLRRVSAAVVVDNRKVSRGDGTVISKPYSEEELVRFTALVKEAVGFDATRNDQVTVTNTAFHEVLDEPEVALPLWERPWFWPLARQVFAVMTVLIIVFGFLRPMVKLWIASNQPVQPDQALLEQMAMDKLSLSQKPKTKEEMDEGDDLSSERPETAYEKRLKFAHKMVNEDPKRVAQLVKIWLASDGRN